MLDLSLYDDFSLNGIVCYLQSTTCNGGRKVVSNEYPYRDLRYIQDLGGLERKFTINVITDDSEGFENKKKLLKMLDDGGQLEMSHPDYGDLKVFCLSYTAENNYINEVGLTRISLNLEVASLNIFPLTAKKKGFLARLKSAILGKNEEKFNKAWKAVKKVKGTFDNTVKTMNSVSKKMKQVAKKIQGAGDGFGKFTSGLNDLALSAKQLVQSPTLLVANLKANFNNLATAYSTAKDVFNIAKDLAKLNFDDINMDGNSQQITNYIVSSAMATCYEQVVLIDYKTTDEIDIAIKELETAFKNMPSTIDKDIYDLLNQARIEAMNTLNALAISLPSLNKININNPISLTNLCYSLYGNLDLLETISKLNKIIDPTAISGDIWILKNA
jgi:prophage DNA circulation protein